MATGLGGREGLSIAALDDPDGVEGLQFAERDTERVAVGLEEFAGAGAALGVGSVSSAGRLARVTRSNGDGPCRRKAARFYAVQAKASSRA